MHSYPLLFFACLVLLLAGINAANEESPNEVDKRRFKSRNPYSWMNRARREVNEAEFDENESLHMPVFTNKRGYRRNPYSWQRGTSSIAESDPSFFDTLFGSFKDKKSPYSLNYGNGRRVRHPYFQKSV